MSNSTPLTTLLNNLNQNDLYPKLVNQIEKDFNLTGIDIDIPKFCPPKTLVNIVSAAVYQLVQYKIYTFMQLLYRIDISEQAMSSDTVASSEVITQKATYEIIKREWQKVQWREKFS